MIISGIDEAGIGCWAGPLVVVSAAFDKSITLPQMIRDSKRLSEVQRERLIDDIYSSAEWVVIKTASARAISARGIWNVWFDLVAELITENLLRGSDQIMVDGTRKVLERPNVRYEAKADALYREVSAASIVAKYVQTSAMEDLHDRFGRYCFNEHHGYGTAFHERALRVFGPTREHRLCYRPVANSLRMHPEVAESWRQLDLFEPPLTCTTTIEGRSRGYHED